ncbi:hypothetical protein CR513_45175, partial [Mucuna pruriens]
MDSSEFRTTITSNNRSSRLSLYRERLGQCQGESTLYISNSTAQNNCKRISLSVHKRKKMKGGAKVGGIVSALTRNEDFTTKAQQALPKKY